MQKVMKLAIIGVMSIILIGCGAAAKEIRVKTQAEPTDVFTDKNADAPASGFAVLSIKATIKTHMEGYYRLESQDSPHGKRGYPFLLNIDGHAETWKVDGQKESLPLYDKEGKTYGIHMATFAIDLASSQVYFIPRIRYNFCLIKILLFDG